MIDPEIVHDNVRVLGPVYASAMLEELKVFRVADRLVELFLTGVLPISSMGTATYRLQNWKHAMIRLSEPERRSVYARALGIVGGDAGGPSNSEFDDLWIRFVASVSALVGQATDKSGLDPGALAQQCVRAAARNLAVNLSQHGGGKVRIVAAELRKQIDVVSQLLSDPEISSAYGAQSMWEVIDQVATLELDGAANIVRYRTMAESGATIFAWLADRSRELSSVAADPILDLDAAHNPRVPNANATTHPTDYDLVNSCEQWLAVSGTSDGAAQDSAQPIPAQTVRQGVEDMLSQSTSFVDLTPASRRAIMRDTVCVADYLVAGSGEDAAGGFLKKVDFPNFVAALIHGVFGTIVTASIDQMKAHGMLVASVVKSLDEFRDKLVTEDRLQDRLGLECDDDVENRLSSARIVLADPRRRLLAAILVLGMSRIAGLDQ